MCNVSSPKNLIKDEEMVNVWLLHDDMLSIKYSVINRRGVEQSNVKSYKCGIAV